MRGKDGIRIMKKRMIVLMIVLFVAMASAPALAQRGYFIDAPAYIEDISAVPGINLTEEQKIEMDTLRESYRKEAWPLQERLSEKKASLRMLWLERNPDQSKIGSMQHEIDGLRKGLREMDREYRRSVNEVLAPEQRDILRSQMRQRRGFEPGACPRHGLRAANGDEGQPVRIAWPAGRGCLMPIGSRDE